MDLDDVGRRESIDRSGMYAKLADFPDQLEAAWQMAVELPQFEQVFVCGMGGSAIGGDIVAAFLSDQGLPAPIHVVRGYALPAHARHGSLVCCISYSGNTEETLSCARDAEMRGLPFTAITSGGRLAEHAELLQAPLVRVPRGIPPRAAMGYLTIPLLRSLSESVEVDVQAEFRSAVGTVREKGLLYANAPEEENPAKQLARAIHGRVPIIYGSAGLTGVAAKRWKTQINENAKQPAYADQFPEVSHNEIMGWEARNSHGLLYIMLATKDPEEHIQRRIGIATELLRERGDEVHEVCAESDGALPSALELIHLGDWVSYYLSLLNEVDPTPVALIEEMKRRLKA